ncbi:protein of unknown function DUF309 [Desulfovibrio sp. X2]|uniref:DUF309 domain-containing protein n=1 Tax=Desulfovibrio sp. X2 TaxID=941449 RepID=UPI0003587003|nr:DUF309 domain-containing protein [Desulfovibrio sp. X2]EPR42465.1 protein of unknown function DUF309 [Desulfovibrio sp. X2]
MTAIPDDPSSLAPPFRSPGEKPRSPKDTLALAVEQFNAGAYFACHETLEELWLAEKEPLRALYQGILQIAVALFHERQGNRRGAVRLLESGMALCTPFSPTAQGLDVAGLLAGAGDCLAALCEAPGSGSGNPPASCSLRITYSSDPTGDGSDRFQP